MKSGETEMFRPARRLYWLAILLGGIWPAPASAGDETIAIESERYRVETGGRSGTIIRIQEKRHGLELLREPRLADNFRFTLPLPGKAAWQATEANYILGKDQRLSSHERTEHGLVLRWNGPLTSVFGKPYDVSAKMTIDLAGDEIRFGFRIENRTGCEIGEVFAPILGGMLGLGDRPEDRKATELVVPASAEFQSAKIFRNFTNHSWLGVLGPEQFYSYPDKLSMPWIELHQPAANVGVYFGAHDPVARFKVMHLEMFPGIAGARREGNWPRPEELQGLPEGVKLSLVHIPYERARTTWEASPVVLRFHPGGSREAAAIYGAWFKSRFDLQKARREWLYQTQAFEDCRGIAFKDLPQWAREGAKRGVRGILLSAWKAGGHEDGVPRFEPDPRWGTRDDLARAIRECHEIGVRVALLVSLPAATQESDWYRKELHQYACRDRWGVEHSLFGWGRGGTLSTSLGSGERRVWLNPGVPGFRETLVRQLRGLAELGVDGLSLQEFFARPMDFNPATGRTPDRASWEGGLECVEAILKACRAVNPEFCVSTDLAWDRVLSVAQASSLDVAEGSPLRAAFATWRPTFTVADGYDFRAVNDAVGHGARIRVAPANQRPMGGPEMNDLASYIQTLLSMREALRETLLDGQGQAGERPVIAGAAACSVFRNARTGQRTAVLVNRGGKPLDVRFLRFPEPKPGPLALWQPATGARKVDLPLRLSIPADEVAIVTEEVAFDRLAKVARWEAPAGAGQQEVIFDFRSANDLEGWKLEGDAFSVCALPGLCSRSTLNSYGKGGEAAVGRAVSPPFTVEKDFGRLRLLYQGGISQSDRGEENLALRFVDAKTGGVLETVLPPGTHVLTAREIPADKLCGKRVRLEIIDRNTAASYAWIGVARLALVRRFLHPEP